MQAWAQGKYQKYQLPGETEWFLKLQIALETGQIDEAVIDRQRPIWIEGLKGMLDARGGGGEPDGGIVLPEWYRPPDAGE